jgi:Tol biopolymer transport system component
MIIHIEYRNWLLPKGNKLTITTDKNKKYDFYRYSISGDKVKELVKENGNDVIKQLVSEGKLIPVYGGEIEY